MDILTGFINICFVSFLLTGFIDYLPKKQLQFCSSVSPDTDISGA